MSAGTPSGSEPVWEILLTACLAAEPAVCETVRRPGGADRNACVVAAEAAAAREGWDKQAWPCVRAGETPALPLTEIAPGVLVHRGVLGVTDAGNGGDIANLGVVIGEEAVAVIDAGGSREVGEALLAAIRARTGKPVRWLILTHMHPDHVLGAAPFAEAGATVIGHRALPQALAARAETYRAAADRALGPRHAPSVVVLPDETVAETREIDLGGRVLRLEAHRVAHTDNDLTVLDEATGVRFLGDLLFMGHMPSLDGSLLGWLAVLDDLAARPASRVVPGHGPAAASWPEAAQPIRTYLEALAAATRAAIAEGVPMLEATRRIAAGAPPGWALTEDFAERNATAAYRELEWE